MNQDERIIFFKNKFDEIVDKLGPLEEKIFINILKDKLNPYRLLNQESDITNAYRLINEIKEESTHDFSSLSNDELKISKYNEWFKQIFLLFNTQTLDHVIEDLDITNNSKLMMLNKAASMIDDYLTNVEGNQNGKNELEKLKTILKRRKEQIPVLDYKEDSEYYFGLTTEKIQKLYDFLKNEYIDDNPNFENSFKIKKKAHINKTLWKKSQRSLFVLLYLLNNKALFFENTSIALISDNIFYRAEISFKAKDSISSLSKISKNLQNDEYLSLNYPLLVDSLAKIIDLAKL
jgi:hypothetical protein